MKSLTARRARRERRVPRVARDAPCVSSPLRFRGPRRRLRSGRAAAHRGAWCRPLVLRGPRAGRLAQPARRLLRRIHAVREVLAREPVVRAVLVHRSERAVDRLLQVRVFLAQAHRGAVAERARILHGRTCPGEALAARRAQEAVVGLQLVLQRRIEAPRAEIGIHLILVLVRHDRHALRLPVRLREGFLGRALLDADALALERLDARRERRARLRDHSRGRVVQLVGEIDLLAALVGDGQRRHDHVELLRLQRGDDAVEILRRPCALRVDPLADFLREIDVESDDLAARRGRFERRIAGVDADPHGLPFLREGAARRKGEGRAQGELLHVVPLPDFPGRAAGCVRACARRAYSRRPKFAFVDLGEPRLAGGVPSTAAKSAVFYPNAGRGPAETMHPGAIRAGRARSARLRPSARRYARGGRESRRRLRGSAQRTGASAPDCCRRARPLHSRLSIFLSGRRDVRDPPRGRSRPRRSWLARYPSQLFVRRLSRSGAHVFRRAARAERRSHRADARLRHASASRHGDRHVRARRRARAPRQHGQRLDRPRGRRAADERGHGDRAQRVQRVVRRAAASAADLAAAGRAGRPAGLPGGAFHRRRQARPAAARRVAGRARRRGDGARGRVDLRGPRRRRRARGVRAAGRAARVRARRARVRGGQRRGARGRRRRADRRGRARRVRARRARGGVAVRSRVTWRGSV
ncbi:hypothetical protein BURPS1710b_1249 [Burkholderia pseudomallei 1710b]|uniref:Uncharacterized protein n=1 Tax=Burkholderia pseudomallei (strain 1710b) TaxID=320372 RepID=Q3JUU4_BURP1|nr:hypothetical protein BURPS1710b_1249 [Burkholderia pseudomallei 1710b]